MRLSTFMHTKELRLALLHETNTKFNYNPLDWFVEKGTATSERRVQFTHARNDISSSSQKT
jgi:hypothetical protein